MNRRHLSRCRKPNSKLGVEKAKGKPRCGARSSKGQVLAAAGTSGTGGKRLGEEQTKEA